MCKKTILAHLFGAALLFSSCQKQAEKPIDLNPSTILINQLGYHPGSDKQALLRTRAGAFQLITTEGEVVYEGTASPAKGWELSGDSVRLADFSGFRLPGTYRIAIDGEAVSHPFSIEENLYQQLADASLKSYYYARCGVDIKPEYGGQWHWKGGHPDTLVRVHASAADANRPEGTVIASPGGWYDAGDYGKYIVNSSITTWTLLTSSALNAGFHKDQNLNIPESGNQFPDILDEALVNLKWMMSMQDPIDGGLYHKLTTKAFDDFIMPEATSKPRYVVQKSTSAALDFSATMATASRLLEKQGMTDLADQMKAAAIRAWLWAEKHPADFYAQPEDISTGAYPDTSLVDEWFWASSELYLLTGEASYRERLREHYQAPTTPKWDVVQSLGIISLLTSDRREEFPGLEKDFLHYADQMLLKQASNPYLISTDKFAWGSNSDVANDGMLKLVAFELTREDRYATSAINDLHYLLGRNATGYSFVTGFGSKSPMHPHNRIMAADGIEAPIPGYIVGGPNTIVPNDCDPEPVVRSPYPAASYTDTQCSFSTNETAINWNAPLVFLSSGICNLTTAE